MITARAPSLEAQRMEFVTLMHDEGIPQSVAIAIMRDAATVQRLAVAVCNGDYPCDNGERQILHCAVCDTGYVPNSLFGGICPSCRAETRITSALAQFGATAAFSGDPRGACVKVVVPSGKTNDWGRTGICVPTRRY